jgi:hypothetical protein
MDAVMDESNDPDEVEPKKNRPAPLAGKERSRKHRLENPGKRKEDPEKVKERCRNYRQKKLEHDAAMEQQLVDAMTRLDLQEREIVAKDAEIDLLKREASSLRSGVEKDENERLVRIQV